MKNKTINNTKVGLFVIAGVLFVVFTLYMIGKNRNLLGATFTVKATVTNVNGLVPGNNVRFMGIDVGSVRSLHVENDSAIIVTMVIDEKIKPFLKKNALVSIGTDGLMGNKLINISAQEGGGDPIQAGDILRSIKPVETDEMLRTLNTTNDNIARISTNLYEITEKLNSSQSLWTLLADTLITKDVKTAVRDFKTAGSNTASMTYDAKKIVAKFEAGGGLAETIFTDSTLSQQLTVSVKQIEQASRATFLILENLQGIMTEINHGEGTASLVLSDTVLREKLFNSATNIEQGTERFNQNMEALKSNFLFRRYFRRLEKKQKNETQAQEK